MSELLFAALFYVFEVYPIIKLVQLIREDLRDGTRTQSAELW
ncbi:MAG TPA: hypothetical protein VIX18_01060 [Nitrospirota bacterium]